MFKEFDYSRKLEYPKISIAKPNKTIIARVPEAYEVTASVYDSELDQIDFKVPMFVENNKVQYTASKGFDLSAKQEVGLVYNETIDKLKEKMLVKVEIGTNVDWFIIDSAEDSRSEEDTYSVSCFALPQEMSHTDTGGDIEEEVVELREILKLLISETQWKLGTVSSSIPKLYRSIGFSEVSILDALFQVGETFNVYLEFDSNKRTINVKTIEEHQNYRGLNIDYGRLLDSYVIKRSSDEIVTRLYVYGADGMGIQNVNPTGLPFIEDFSYFLFPFEYDDTNNKVIKSSFYMSDALAIALHKYKKAQTTYENEIIKLNEDIIQLRIDIGTYESDLSVLNLALDGIQDRLDTAKASDASAEMINGIQLELKAKQVEVNQKKAQIEEANGTLAKKNERLEAIQTAITTEAKFTEALKEELQYFIIKQTWTNEDYVDEQELFDAGLIQFEKQKIPKTLIDISVANLFNVLEEDFYKDKIKVGDIARVTDYQRNVQYKAPIISIDYDFDEGTAQLKIADDSSLLDANGKLNQILNDAQHTADVVQGNGKYWDSVKDLGSVVSQIITGEWDANKNQISAGVNNEITMGKRGIMVTNPDRPEEVIIIQSGIIALSEDGGETWKTAIKPTGIVAERLIGRIIVGEELLIGNKNNGFVLDENGARFDVNQFKIVSSSGDNLVEQWQYAKDMIDNMVTDDRISPYEKRELRDELAKMAQRQLGIVDRCKLYFEDPTKLPEYVNFVAQWKKVYDYFFVKIHLGDTKPLLDPTNVGTTVGIDRTEFTGLFRDFETKLYLVENALTEHSNTLLQETQSQLDAMQNQIQDIMDDKVYTCRLTSTNGTTFLNNNVSTKLIAELLYGNEDVTAKVPASGFVWKKFDKDGAEDTNWTKNHIAVGNTVDIDRNDVFEKAVFEVSFYYDNVKTRAERVGM